VKVAPTAGTLLSNYIQKKDKKEISSDEITLILLSKVVDNETIIINTQEQISKVLENHIAHEDAVLKELCDTMKASCTVIKNLDKQTRALTAKLVDEGLIKL